MYALYEVEAYRKICNCWIVSLYINYNVVDISDDFGFSSVSGVFLYVGLILIVLSYSQKGHTISKQDDYVQHL